MAPSGHWQALVSSLAQRRRRRSRSTERDPFAPLALIREAHALSAGAQIVTFHARLESFPGSRHPHLAFPASAEVPAHLSVSTSSRSAEENAHSSLISRRPEATARGAMLATSQASIYRASQQGSFHPAYQSLTADFSLPKLSEALQTPEVNSQSHDV